MVSRCQRFDLSRIKSSGINYLKDVKQKENGLASDEALKLIVKFQGSIRDALSLLDRGLLSTTDGKNSILNKPKKYLVILTNLN